VEILSATPLCVTTLLWQGEPGEWTLTVSVKLTLSIEHEREAVLSDVQLEATGDRPHGEVPGASLREPTDLVPFKPRVDVMLVGHAYAPGGVPVPELVATLRVGELEKSVRVLGDRDARAGRGAAPVPFALMPLRYERAARDADNPVGVDGSRALPNLTPLIGGQAPTFGPLSPDWACRRELLDRAGQGWARALRLDTAVAQTPAPPALELAYFNAAPFEQRIALLRPGTAIELIHLHPMHERFVTRIPALRPRVYLKEPTLTRPRELPLRCDTLWIDADDGLATLTFRGLVGVASGDASALPPLLVVLQAPDLPPPLVQLEALLRAQGTASEGLAEAHPLALRHDAVKGSESSLSTLASASAAPPAEPRAAAPLTEPPPPSSLTSEPRDGDLPLAASGGRTVELSLPQHLADVLPFAHTPSLPEDVTTDALPEETTQGLGHSPAVEELTAQERSSALPIDVAAYAALVVLVERGEAARAVTALGLAPTALLGLLDLYATRMEGDAALQRQVARFVDDARNAEPLP
jgi:hypothetical protein